MKNLTLTSLLFLLSLISSVCAEADVTIAGIYSITGFGAIGGTSELNAARLAVNEINAAGGIQGHKINFVVEDNQSDLRQTTTAFKKLVAINKPLVLLGPNWSEFSEIVAPLAQSSKTVMITSSGYKDGMVIGKDYVFTLLPAFSKIIVPFADHILKTKPKRIALLTSHNAYYQSLSKSLKEYLDSQNHAIWKEFEFEPTEQDYRSTIVKLQNEEVDAVVAFLLEGGVSANFLKQAQELNFKHQFYFGPSLAFDEVVLEQKNLANGAIFFTFRGVENESFNKKYREQFGSEPQLGAGKAYDSVYLVKTALENCGFEPDAFKSCIEKTDTTGVSGYLAFDKDGNFAGDSNITKLMRVENGNFKALS